MSSEGVFTNIAIDTRHARTLEAVVFCPGYETVSFYEPALATSELKRVIAMKPLPMLHLSGRIDSYQPVSSKEPIVDISYPNLLGFSHLVIVDILLPSYQIASVPLAPDGTFTAEIPDFFHDPIYHQDRPEENRLSVMVRDKPSNNILLLLSTDRQSKFGGLKIQPEYPGMVTFHASPRP